MRYNNLYSDGYNDYDYDYDNDNDNDNDKDNDALWRMNGPRNASSPPSSVSPQLVRSKPKGEREKLKRSREEE